jgi:hypothetical protein
LKPIRVWLALSLALVGLVFAGASLAGDSRKPGAEGADAAQVAELRQLLRQAQELQKQEAQKNAKPEQAGVPAKPGEEPAGQAETDTEKAEKKPVVRAGCMYSGVNLIWEKVPGSCEK